MRFLKYTLPVVLSVAVLCSCTKVASDPLYSSGERIIFHAPMMTVETKSTLKDALVAGDAFGVIGYCIPYSVGTSALDPSGATSNWSTKRNLCPPNVFYGQKVTVTGDGCEYDYSSPAGTGSNNPKYWYRWDVIAERGYGLEGTPDVNATSASDNYSYSFFAYYPYEGAFGIRSPANASEAGAPKLSFTMPQTGNNVNSSIDHTQTPDAMVSVLYNARSGDNLQFSMSHILTGLGFEVNNFSERNLVVHNITLSGRFYKQVDIDFTSDVVAYTFPDSRYTGTYTVYSEDASGPLNLPAPAEGEAVTSSESPIGGEHILLISGKENAYFGDGTGENEIRVNIDYTFDGTRKMVFYTRPGTFTPRPGIKYTAQLNFVGDAFVLQFVVDNADMWEDGEMDDEDGSNDDIIFQ